MSFIEVVNTQTVYMTVFAAVILAYIANELQ